MRHLQLAQQAFDALSPGLHGPLDECISDRTEVWLRDDVCRVVEGLIGKESFQFHARWSVDHLTQGAQTTARQAVERVDQSFVALAQEMSRALTGRDATDLDSAYPEGERDRETIAWIANRPWDDLVSIEDFFHPWGGLQLHPNSSDRHGDFRSEHRSVFDQRELRFPLGDYISRAMFARVEYWHALLDRLAGIVLLFWPP